MRESHFDGICMGCQGDKVSGRFAAQTKLPGVAFDARNESSSCGDTGLRMDIRPVPR